MILGFILTCLIIAFCTTKGVDICNRRLSVGEDGRTSRLCLETSLERKCEYLLD